MTVVFYLCWMVFGGAIVGGILALVSRSPGQRWLGRALTVVAALFFSAIAVYLFAAGSRAGWSSDGPGILGLILILAAFAGVATVCWVVLLLSFRPRG
jgi:hypothetical protein